MRFEFSTAGRILFGAGAVKEVGSLISGWSRRVLVVTGASDQRAEDLLSGLRAADVSFHRIPTAGEPEVHTVVEAVNEAVRQRCEAVIGFGGGSAMDAAKATAALMTNPGPPLAYLEVVGEGKPLQQPAAPCITVPTTAGSGAEVTRNAVLRVGERRVKVSLRSRKMLARLAVVDPTLTHSLPPEITAATGMDALVQLVEPYVSPFATPFTDGFCREGLLRAAGSLETVFLHGGDSAARENMALAALFGGLALDNAKVGAVHGIAGPLGGMIPAAHGALCARLLPFVTATNLRALRERAPDAPALQRYAEVAQMVTGSMEAEAEDGVEWMHRICDRLQVPGLSDLGLSEKDLPELVEKAKKASSMKGNPVILTDAQLFDILRKAL